MAFVKVAKISDVAEGFGIMVSIEGIEVALFNVGGKFYAMNNTCAHRGGPLGEGMLEGATVTCPWHGWQYDIVSGKGIMPPSAQIPTYKVKVEGEDVLVSVD